MKSFPFPDKIESREELTRDILFRKIQPEQKERISNEAWDIGVKAMQKLISEYPGKGIVEICQAKGLKIVHESKDSVAGNIRFFSEYYSGKKQIVLNDKSVKLWAQANKLKVRDAEELILSHEMFHHLECTELGLTSNIYKVPWIKIGNLEIGTCGIRALSEIGAHGFSRTYYDMTGRFPKEPFIASNDQDRDDDEPAVPKTNGKLRNYALNEADLRASQGFKAFTDNAFFRMLSGKKK